LKPDSETLKFSLKEDGKDILTTKLQKKKSIYKLTMRLKGRLPPSGPASWLRSDSGNRSIGECCALPRFPLLSRYQHNLTTGKKYGF